MRLHSASLFVHAVAITLSSTLGLGITEAANARQNKVALCHLNGNGAYKAINVAGAAERAHLEHGDSKPGDIVPGSGGRFSFAEDCRFVPACPCAEDLPENWTPDTAISGTNIELCENPPPDTVSDVFGSATDSTTGASLGWSKDVDCENPTVYSCTADSVTREISEAQYSACLSLGSP
jgi:hypothetical protein